MVASTLVPTFLHLCLAFVSLVTWVRAGMWNALLDRLNPEEPLDGSIFASIAMTGILFLYLTVPPALIVGTVWGIWNHGGVIREWYVQRLIELAHWAGFL